jgi:ABC-type transport system substrate-binding protein
VPDPGRSYRVAAVPGGTGRAYGSNALCDHTISNNAGLYTIAMPGTNVVAELAESDQPPEPRPEGDVWVVDVPLRRDALWSDGYPITANDVAFTFNTVARLPGYCRDLRTADADSEQAGVLSVEALDPHTVRIAFNADPGLGVWPYDVGMTHIVAEHFWAPLISEAEAAGQDVVKTLSAVSAADEPAAGPMLFVEEEPGVQARYVTNPLYFRTGDVVRSGDVTYTIGPFIDELIYVIYGSDEDAALGLIRGEIDQMYMPPEFAPAFQALLDRHGEGIARMESEGPSFTYLGLNLRKPPMNDIAFRRALAVMVDRELITQEVIPGLDPAWTLLPPGNKQFLDGGAADELAAKYRGMSEFERLEKAVEILKEADYTWEREPAVRQTSEGKPYIEAGSDIRLPDGEPLDEPLEIINVGIAQFINFRIPPLWVEYWLQNLGIPARAVSIDAQTFVSRVWPGVGGQVTFDMLVLNWSTGPPFPAFYESFLHSEQLAELNDGNNAVGYVNPEFDRLTEQLARAKTTDDVKRIVWELEAVIDRDLPYIVLFHWKHLYGYSTRIEYPFEQSFGGLFAIDDAPELVRIRD